MGAGTIRFVLFFIRIMCQWKKIVSDHFKTNRLNINIIILTQKCCVNSRN